MITTKSIFASEGADDRSLEFLANAIEQNNLPGFDYFEYKRAVFTLQQMPMSEETAHKSAFTTAATVGLTKDKLIETARFYLDLLQKEKTNFDAALENQNKTKVAARVTETKRLRDQVDRNKAEIIRLQDEIANYLTQIEQAEGQIKIEEEKIASRKSAFEKTHQSVILQIEKDVELMHKFL